MYHLNYQVLTAHCVGRADSIAMQQVHDTVPIGRTSLKSFSISRVSRILQFPLHLHAMLIELVNFLYTIIQPTVKCNI